MAEIALIYNPNAGRPANGLIPYATSNTLDAVRRYLKSSRRLIVPEYLVETPDETQMAARHALESGARLVLVSGGDGTLRAAGEAMLGSGATMGILPSGTVNVLARELGIPVDNLERAAQIALTGRTVSIDIGQISTPNKKSGFLLMCSVGFDAAAIASVDPNVKNVLGSGAYVLAGLVNVASYAPSRYVIQIDDADPMDIEAFTIVIANAGLYGGDYRIVPDASLSDGLLDILIFTAPANQNAASQKASFFRQVTNAMRGKIVEEPDTLYRRARRISLSAADPADVQIDGDHAGLAPIICELLPRALSVKIPNP